MRSRRPLTVHVAATGAGGVRAYDKTRVYPRHWLPTEVAGLVTGGVRHGAVEECRRFGAPRVDCRQDISSKTRCATTSVRLAAAGLRWGRYGCRLAAHPRFRRRPHPLARRSGSACRTRATARRRSSARVSEADLLPSD